MSLVAEPPAPSPSIASPPLTAADKIQDVTQETPQETTQETTQDTTARTGTSLRTRIAELRDARCIHQLIHSFTHDGTLLPRRYAEICANISTFTVVETDTGQFIGCAALHVYGPHLAEVRSIVVRPDTKGHGAGGLLVRSVIDQAKANGIRCVCLFTRIPGFFKHFDFRVAEHQIFKDKVEKDCAQCARRKACDEIAMAIGELPSARDMPLSGVLQPLDHQDLVQLQV
jgi:amino-acid N-acetyltransferase